jgi:hypothetical protein
MWEDITILYSVQNVYGARSSFNLKLSEMAENEVHGVKHAQSYQPAFDKQEANMISI